MNPNPLVCPGPVERWFPHTEPPGWHIVQVQGCYDHTTTVVGAGIILVFGLLGLLVLLAMNAGARRRPQ